jgi:MFS family permease
MASRRWLIPLCLASVLWSFSFGVNAALAPLWMQNAGYDSDWIGWNTGTYYLGIALASGAVPWLMQRFGATALFAGMLASAVTAAAFPWGGGLTGWFVLRALNGMAGAVSLIPLETYVNRTSEPSQRATNFGYYAFCIALGMALGSVVALQLRASAPHLAFLLAGAAGLAGALIIPLWRPVFHVEQKEQHDRTPLGFRRNVLAFGSGWSQGFLEGGMVAHLSIYLLALGLGDDTVGFLMGGLMIGVILAQPPLAWLADRLGRAAVLAGCNVVALAGIGCLMYGGGTAWLACWLFVVGACSGAFYPLGLALLGERTPTAAMGRAGAWFLAINCVGSLGGPVIAGEVMVRLGRNAMFIAGGGAIALVLVVWLASELFSPREQQPVAETELTSTRNAA